MWKRDVAAAAEGEQQQQQKRWQQQQRRLKNLGLCRRRRRLSCCCCCLQNCSFFCPMKTTPSPPRRSPSRSSRAKTSRTRPGGGRSRARRRSRGCSSDGRAISKLLRLQLGRRHRSQCCSTSARCSSRSLRRRRPGRASLATPRGAAGQGEAASVDGEGKRRGGSNRSRKNFARRENLVFLNELFSPSRLAPSLFPSTRVRGKAAKSQLEPLEAKSAGKKEPERAARGWKQPSSVNSQGAKNERDMEN